MGGSQSSSAPRGYLSQQSGCSEASETGHDWSESDPLCRLPEELLQYLFSYVPPRQLVRVCRRVSKAWRDFFDDPSFWQLRMKRRGNYDAKLDHAKSRINWAKLCLYSVHEPNLVKSFDSSGDVSLEPWKIIYDDWRQLDEKNITKELKSASSGRHAGPRGWGGDGWSIEEWIRRDEAKDQDVLKENEGSCKNYVTSYYWCCRWQLIDLDKHGFTPEVMDTIQPPIFVSEWFCARWDCGSIFKIKVVLLDKDFKFVKVYEHSEETKQWEGGELGWRKVEHIFREYGAGVRYVLFVDGGKDTKWWAGHYGSKMAAANVQVKFNF